MKPVEEWDMSFPTPLKALCNKYEMGQVALCGLFSDTVKKASMSTYHHGILTVPTAVPFLFSGTAMLIREGTVRDSTQVGSSRGSSIITGHKKSVSTSITLHRICPQP